MPDSREMCMAGLWWSIRDYECHWFSLDSEGGHGRLGALDDSVVHRITGVKEGKSKPSDVLMPGTYVYRWSNLAVVICPLSLGTSRTFPLHFLDDFYLDSSILYFQTLTLSIPVAPFSSPHGMGGITIHKW